MTAVQPTKVRKRDGRLEPFDAGRIHAAVAAAAREAGRDPDVVAGAVTPQVVAALDADAPSVEHVQDAVERALMTGGRDDVARAYVLYRQRRAELREAKELLGVVDELKLTANAATVLKERYLLRDDDGEVVESTGALMDRVARAVAAAEDAYAPGSAEGWAERFAGGLRRLEFLPNSPTLMNAGTDLGVLSGCFVLPVADDLEAIFETLKEAALIHQAGGGTGFAFSALRPAGDVVRSSHGVASGPLSFMRVFDVATDVLKQGGKRRGANMAVLDCRHPDVEAFARAKATAGSLENFNLSVGATDAFLQAVVDGGTHALVNPRSGEAVRTVDAAALFDRIAEQAWATGDPGLLFLDRINAANPVPAMGEITATNPCGEVPLLPYESCNLGSVNLARHLTGDEGDVDWEHLDATVRLVVRFLDDVIDVNRYPVPQLDAAARATRKVGLGVMGLAELLATLGVPYDSEEALALAERLAARIQATARAVSEELAAERGPFPRWADSVFARDGLPPRRNAQLTSVAPTGTISVIAGTTSGVEPMFAVAYVRNVLGTRLVELNPRFERLARGRGFYAEALMHDLARSGRVGDHPDVPEDVRRAFVTALEISPDWHLRMQAVWQRHVDAAVSKTVNLPADAGVEDVRRLYLDAWRAGVKGITVYRYGSKPRQVLT
jgi:ribonucleoside-diphosphate reductase alpha chain